MTEIEKLLELNYEDCCNYFINKYGKVGGNYFNDEECTRKNTKVTRGKEGLYIHHIDEDKAILLSTPEYARENPFEFQKADRLVYCNLLEHLLLHIKIFEYPNKNKNIGEDVGIGGIYNFIAPELNDIYSGISYKQPWKQKVVEVVIPLKSDYFKCIEKLLSLGFDRPLLRSFYFNELSGIWNPEKNKEIFDELRKLGVKN
ncbi:hypothetical protein [Spiroplasma alleghenense]|uniref:Uncharacterized protein n=1 Tax=Spiroplasma alleghenense TaxID=216931 RepID=A0A345Z4V8_9MOLU|nr:hypothetical protein [Spiroplasma alleghenense]AXK51637.1 hypothetical protein SALLE_v1c09670 [Spiroplasma alleghenense]